MVHQQHLVAPSVPWLCLAFPPSPVPVCTLPPSPPPAYSTPHPHTCHPSPCPGSRTHLGQKHTLSGAPPLTLYLATSPSEPHRSPPLSSGQHLQLEASSTPPHTPPLPTLPRSHLLLGLLCALCTC